MKQIPKSLCLPLIHLQCSASPNILKFFSSLTTHSDPDIIRAAIFAIGALPNPQAADALISFLGEDGTINKLVVQALAEKQDLYDLEK